MNQKEFLPFALPDIGDDEINEVVHSLKSGWVTTGPKTKQFETEFSSFLLNRFPIANINLHSIAVNSATAGLHLALEALGVGPGDEVITTTHTFTATAEVVRYLGADPIFVDIDPQTLNINTGLIESKITPKTKVIIPVHFAGLVCDMDKIIKIAKKHNLKIVEDAAHTLPADYKGQTVGTFATDITVFSFYATKTITTGEGGMIVTQDETLAQRMKVMRLHGINRDAFDRYTSKKPSWYYEVVAPGFKYNLTDLASSMGLHQLKKADKFQYKRQNMAYQYNEAFKSLPLILPPDAVLPNSLHSWHLYVLRLSDECQITRDEVIEKMFELGIGCSVHFIPLHRQPYWREKYNLQEADFSESDRCYLKTLSLPLYTKMTESDQARVIDSLTQILCG